MADAHSPKTDDEAFARLVRWIEEAGGKLAPLVLRMDAGRGRGVQAARRIGSGEVVLRIPHRCLLTRESAQSSAIGQKLTAAGIIPPTSHTWLAAYLLQERGASASPFRPYLDLLPASHPHIPLLFDARDLSFLRGSFTLHRIREKKETLAREYHYLTRAIPALRAFSYEQFVWARLTVLTRVFGITIAGLKTQALVPVADLLNHAQPRQTNWGYVDSTNGFAMTALREFSPGDEVHDSYGRKCNSRFFMNYGFALPDNDDNEARLVFETPRGEQAFVVPARFEAPSTQQMFAFLRSASPPGPRNEENALRMLAEACIRALGAFDTTLAEDDALLEGPAKTGNARTCILVRRGEKRVLHAFLELARTASSLPGAT